MIQKGKLKQIEERAGRFALFKCECGNEKMIKYGDVARSDKKAITSCGCSQRKGIVDGFDDYSESSPKYARLKQVGPREGRFARFLCDCGAEKVISIYSVASGHTKSCGCISKEVASVRFKTHGQSRSSLYSRWVMMKDRCYNPKNIGYKNYGGRGITVCDRWKVSFENFKKDMGNIPTEQHSLDRKDNSKGYTPENCKWSDKVEQTQNRRVRKNGKSSYRGVSFRKDGKVWVGRLSIPSTEERLYLGRFKTEIEAAKAYDAKVIELGLKRHINFPEDYKDQETNILNKIQ